MSYWGGLIRDHSCARGLTFIVRTHHYNHNQIKQRPGEEDEDDDDETATAASTIGAGGTLTFGHPLAASGLDAKTWLGRLYRGVADTWAWVERADVLSQRMARGLLLHGFHEQRLAFPPSFKWRVRGPPPKGEYAEGTALQAAFLTRRGHEGSEMVPPSYTDRILVRVWCHDAGSSHLSPFTNNSIPIPPIIHHQSRRSAPSPTPPPAPS